MTRPEAESSLGQDVERPRRSSRMKIVLWALVVVAGLVIAVTYNKRHQIYAQIVLSRVAHNASAAETSSTEEKALEVFDGVLNIARLNALGSVPIDDNPAWTLVRGLGYCDSAAMAFVQVAERSGLQARVTFLMNEEGVSPHAVAEVLIDDEWRVFDVLKRSVSRRPDGALATAEDISTGVAPSTASDVEPAWFAEPEVFYDPAADVSFRDRARDLVILAADIAGNGWIGDRFQDLYLMTPPPTMENIDGDQFEDWETSEDYAYWRARNYDVFGRRSRAVHLYSDLVEKENEHKDEAAFFLAGQDEEPVHHEFGR